MAMAQTAQHDDKEAVEGTPVSTEVAVGSKAPVTAQELDAHLRTEGTRDGDAPSSAHDSIIAQVLSASTPDAVLTPIEALQGQDILGLPLLLFGYDLNKSEYDVGSPFYASMHVVRMDNEEQAVVNCGHKKVLAQLVKLREFDQFPYQVMFRTRGTSSVGTPMLELVKWEPQTEEKAPF